MVLAGLARASDVSSSVYVQDGLVAHWDGIDNTLTNGVRFHDNAATNWCDLSGQGNDVWMPSFVAVESNALYSTAMTGKAAGTEADRFQSGKYPSFPALNGLNHGTNDPPYTVEIVMQRVQWRYTDNYGNLQTVFRTPRGTVGYRLSSTNGFYFLGPTSKSNLSLMNWPSSNGRADETHTVSAVLGNSLSTDIIWLDGLQHTISMNGNLDTTWYTNFIFFSNSRADIRVHAIRVYNRVLTQYEVERHTLIDQLRFLGNKRFLIKPVPDQTLDGVHPCEPDPFVMDPVTEQRLVKDTDYTLSYTANDRAGFATVIVTGIGAWSGYEATAPFLICSADAYRVIEYIQSSGTQYINTEYYPNPNTRMEAELLFVGDVGDRSAEKVGHALFGCSENNGLVCFSMNFGSQPNQDNELFPWLEKTSSQGGTRYSKVIDSRTVRSTLTVDASTGEIQYGTVKWTAAAKTTTHAVNPLHLFGSCGTNGVVTPITVFGMRVFSWKIWDGDTLVRDFVPCYRVFDVSAGLWDRVSGRFFKNAGTGEFSYEYDASLPAEYRQLDGIIATGAQYIATGVYATSNTTVMVELTPYETTAQRRVFAARATASSAVTANDLFFESYISSGTKRWACCCTDGPYNSGSDAAGLWSSGTVTPSAGTRTALTLDSYSDTFFVSGVKQVALARARSRTSPAQIELMRAGGSAAEYGWGKLYAAYIWQNGTLQRSLVPCYRVADGLTGFYDLVTETFLPSAGEFPFLHGMGGEVGIPHFTGVYQLSGLNANVSFSNLTNFSFTVWTKNPDVGSYGVESQRYGVLIGQGALASNNPGFACFISHNMTSGSYTLAVQTCNAQNQTCTLSTSASTIRTDGRWHHIAYAYDLGAGVARLYLDGQAVASNTDLANMVNPSTWAPVTIGVRNGGDYPMKGMVAYATLWDRAITAGEVELTRRRPVTGTEDGLIGCWSLDGGSTGLLDGVANGATRHDLAPVGEVGFAMDEVKWHVPGLMILVR